MSTIKNVAIFGASGSLGAPILKVLLASEKFNVTVITRTGSKSTFPDTLKTIPVDYTSIEEVTEALQNQDAVVSAVGTEGFLGQKVFVDAAIAAGVQRFVPSEFGSDLSHPKVAPLAVFGYKVAIRKYLEEKVAAGAKISYTFVVNSGFLDWGLEHNFLLNWKAGKPEIFDSGDQLFSATSLESVGQAVVGVLTHLEETKNRQVKVQDLQVSQNQLLAIAKKVDPKRTWEPVPINVKELEVSVAEKLAGGDYSMGVMYDQIKLSMFGGNEYGQPFESNDNELLGVAGNKTDADIEAILKTLML
jgi:uncharacterized protein YbjT (DUF2867 family)